jgi:hypothetical protein
MLNLYLFYSHKLIIINLLVNYGFGIFAGIAFCFYLPVKMESEAGIRNPGGSAPDKMFTGLNTESNNRGAG